MTTEGISARERDIEQRLREDERQWVQRCRPRLVGKSPAFLDALQIARLAAEDGDCTVLLTGETGTGKELVARAIHEQGTRSEGPFVAVNAASLPAALADSLLFGHEKGAYTDATEVTQGLLLASHGGTVFLDEIQGLDLSVQAKLLRFLQDREVMPLGGERTRRVDVRVIAGTNEDLGRAVHAGAFRADLYFRLNVLPIHLPPLRERRRDIPLLTDHFLVEFNAKKGSGTTLAPDAIAALITYDWPGNVRELRNLIERLVILNRDRTVGRAQLPFVDQPKSVSEASRPPMPDIDLKSMKQSLVAEFERNVIYQRWQAHEWNITRTATSLGESRQWLTRQIRKYGLTRA
jgi:DNA-binding NtrC family response regulator